MKKKIAAITASLLCLTCTAPVQPICAATETEPIACVYDDGFNLNLHNYSYSLWTNVAYSNLVPLDGGGWMRVQTFCERKDQVHVEYYDADFRMTKRFCVPKLMPDYGAFYHASDGYNYLITGDSEITPVDESPKFDIAKYSPDWKLIAHVQTAGCNVTQAFPAGTVRCADDGEYMIIHTSHRMDSGHQSNYAMVLNMADMRLEYEGDKKYAYTSHSFNQFVLLDKGDTVMLNHGDSYPRAVSLTRCSESGRSGTVFMAEYGDTKDADLSDMKYLNYTGVAVGGFAQSNTHYLVAYNTINPDLWYDLATDMKYRTAETARNIMIAAVPKDDLTQENVIRTAVTAYPDDGVSAGNPYLVSVGDDRLMLLWQHGEKIQYVFLDGNGALSGEQYELEGYLSDCEPVVSGGKLYWYTWDQADIRFYSIDLEHPEKTEIVQRKAAHEFEPTEPDAEGNVYDVCTKCGLRIPHDDPRGFQAKIYKISSTEDRWIQTLIDPETEHLEIGDEIEVYIDKFNITDDIFFKTLEAGEAKLPFDFDTMRYTVSEFDAPAVMYDMKIEPWYERNKTQNIRFMAKHNYQFVSMQQPDGDTADSITLKCADCGHTATFAADALSGKKDETVRAALENDNPTSPAVTVSVINPETGEETNAEWGIDYTVAYVGSPNKNLSYAVIVAATDSRKLKGSAVIPFDSTSPVRLAGDVNTDGTVNQEDAALLEKWLCNDPGAALADWQAGDINYDAQLNAIDLTLLKRALLAEHA